MNIVVNLDPETGKYTLEHKAQAEMAFEAIRNSFTEEELVKFERCPLCNHKTASKMHHYVPTKRMISILFAMRRTIMADPEQHGYVLMREESDTIKDSEALYSMAIGSQQNHKMCYLGLITQIDKECNPVEPGTPGKMQAAYKITEKGETLMQGEPITPWKVHRKMGRTIITDEDRQTSGTTLDAKHMSYDDWVDMCKNAGVDCLKIPEAANA